MNNLERTTAPVIWLRSLITRGQKMNNLERTTAPRLRMFCDHCGSENVGRDAYVSWNKETQEWELGGIYDNGFCNDCGRDDPIEEEEIDGGDQ